MSLTDFITGTLISVDTDVNPVTLTMMVDGVKTTLPFAEGFFEDEMEELGECMERALRPGDTIRYSRYDSVYDAEPSIAFVLNPRPIIDKVTFDYLQRAGVDLDEVARLAADRCWLWSIEDDGSEFEIAIGAGLAEGRDASCEDIRLKNLSGTIVLDEMHYGDGKDMPTLELRGDTMYVSPLGETTSMKGRPLSDLVPMPRPGCFLSGDEIIEEVHENGCIVLASDTIDLPTPTEDLPLAA